MIENVASSDRSLLQELRSCVPESVSELHPKQVIKFKAALSKTTCDCVTIQDAGQLTDLIKIVHCITTPALVKELPEKEERDYDTTDFVGVADAAKDCLICLKLLLPKLHVGCQEPKLLQSFLIPVLKLCATHSQVFLWSCDDAVCLSTDVLEALLQLTESSDVKTLLCQKIAGCENTLYKAILLSLRPTLTKETWTQNASSCQIFKWLLFHVKHPYLVDYLSDVLPPSLMFTDHHATRNKVLGIQCLDFIIDNVPPTELKMYGRADVVYDALFNHVYRREAEIVQVLYPCILKLLSGQEKSHSNPNQSRKWCRCDDVFSQFLWNMELEDNIIARREMSSHAIAFIEHLGITVIKHLKRTKRILLTYLSVCEGPEEISRINALRALSALIKIIWPRLENHCESIVKGILYLVYDIETGSATPIPEVKERLLICCTECLSLLRLACPSKMKELISSLDDVSGDIPGIQFLQEVCNEHP